MNEFTEDHHEEDACPKRGWVMSVLSDDDDHDDASIPPGLKFHLSRCPSCQALASDTRNVTDGLSDLASDDADPSLFERTNRQALSALQRGGELTGRVDIAAEPMASLRMTRPWWHPSRMAPLATAAAVLLAVAVYALRPDPAADSVSRQGEDAGTTSVTRDVPKKENPQAALASDAIETNGDPTGIPPEYRGEDCEGENCVERAFVPGRGRRSTGASRLDTAPRPESTRPAPNDP